MLIGEGMKKGQIMASENIGTTTEAAGIPANPADAHAAKRKKRLIILANVVACAVGMVAFFTISSVQSSRAQAEYIENATQAVNALFEDEDHTVLAYFSSRDTTGFDRAFNEARRHAVEINDSEIHQSLITLSDEARILYSTQLRAFSMVEGLFCDTFEACPEPPYDCRPSLANTEENIADAYAAINEVSNEVAQAVLLERMQMLGVFDDGDGGDDGGEAPDLHGEEAADTRDEE